MGNACKTEEDPLGLGLHKPQQLGVHRTDFSLFESHAREVWAAYADALEDPSGSDNADGIAAEHSRGAREEAVRKLITNHRAFLNDICNPSKTLNIDGKPLTQTELVRVDCSERHQIDWMLREVARRLLGGRKGLDECAEKSNGKNPDQAKAWQLAVIYVSGRIQSNKYQKAGREPDMSDYASKAMLAVMQEVAFEAEVSHPAWALMLEALKHPAGSDKADGAAAGFNKQVRDMAAGAIIVNHKAIIAEAVNTSKYLDVYGKTLKDPWTERVDPACKVYVDQMLREASRRLLGKRTGMAFLTWDLDPKNIMQTKSFKDYSTFEEKHSETAIMTPEANTAFKKVLQELANEAEIRAVR